MPRERWELAGVAQAFRDACRAELNALKPGNVHVFRDGHGMTVETFERAAEVAAVRLVSGLTVGERIEGAVKASLAAVGVNANLGILLLCAPLTEAALTRARGDTLRSALNRVLDRLTVADAEAAYRAISSANPGGLGRAERARCRRRRQKSRFGRRWRQRRTATASPCNTSPASRTSLRPRSPMRRNRQGREAVEDVYLGLLSLFPDSHVARKFGLEAAERLRRRRPPSRPGSTIGPSANGRSTRSISTSRRAGLNPGTTADLTVAAIFTATLKAGPEARLR